MSRGKEAEGEEGREDWEHTGNSSDDFSCISPPRKRLCEANQKENSNWSAVLQPQDADYSLVPSLNYDLEDLIVARLSRAEYWKFYSVNKRFSSILKSGELFKIRRVFGFQETTVFMLASGDSSWWAFDGEFKDSKKLPELPSELCFKLGDKESLCAGTHLIVSGKEVDGGVIWRYKSQTNKWLKGPSMKSPRCLFASASCGTYAYVAGGLGLEAGAVLNTAEKYNPKTESWECLQVMNEKRKLCSGCYMDNKFYVIGGRNEQNDPLDSAEAYNEDSQTWELIPQMLNSEDFPKETFQSPPLVAVVNNELYSLETSSNELRMYLKKDNKWKKLGKVPVRADVNRGWGVAFKSLGNELLVIGASAASHESMSIYTCCPNSDAVLQWRLLECGKTPLSHFIHNCSVMIA